jgi:aminomethyltransferase
LIVAADHTGEGGFDVYLRATEAAGLRDKLTASGIPIIGESAAEMLRIEAGIPRYGVDMDESNIPLECNLEATHISHTKGCYIGQEIIARIHSRGHTNRGLTGFLVEGSELPKHGDRIYVTADAERREAGWLTSAVNSATVGRPISLGYLRHEFSDGKHDLATAEGIRLTMHPLPFVRSALAT